jgi:hypothetical protein
VAVAINPSATSPADAIVPAGRVRALIIAHQLACDGYGAIIAGKH